MSGISAVKAKVSLSSSLSFVKGESGASDLHGFWFREIRGTKRGVVSGPGTFPGSNSFPAVAGSLAVGKPGVDSEGKVD